MASRYPIKKWAAAAALAAATFYLLLSGAEVATQRSFIMIAIVLAGIMVDRPTLTFRTITVAALGVLLLSPESVVNPSFQMSFAATLALIAAYQHGLPWCATADTSRGARIALWGGQEIVGLILASFVAGLGTTPYVAYHFHRTAPYGVIANLLAMPVVSAEVMPMGILGVLAMSFGFDAIFWKPDGLRHHLDGYGRALGDEPAGRRRAGAGVRDRTAARDGGNFAGVAIAHAAALERRRAGADCRPVGGRNAATGHSGFWGRPGRSHPGARWPARGAAQQPRQLLHQGVACRRR
jgi:ComEC/Rec2-related protein